jgi:hypothetical protein
LEATLGKLLQEPLEKLLQAPRNKLLRAGNSKVLHVSDVSAKQRITMTFAVTASNYLHKLATMMRMKIRDVAIDTRMHLRDTPAS